MTVLCMILLYLHTGQIENLRATASADISEIIINLRINIIIKTALAFLALMTIIIVSVYKPWGMTPYGRNKLQKPEQINKKQQPVSAQNKVLYFLMGLLVIVVFYFIHRYIGGPHLH